MKAFSYRYTHPLKNALEWERSLKTKSEKYWIKRGEAMQLALFHDMAERVPAYKKFLKSHHIDPKRITTSSGMRIVPTIDKDNYLRKYPLQELCWDGKLSEVHSVISSTSGSTGEPFYFPRTALQDEQYALLAELYLRTNFSIEKKRTLYINAFPLGVWIGGLFTYAAISKVAERGNYPLSLINPGINIPAVLRAIQKFSQEFDQILIGSYGPFLKDILDEGERMGISWEKLNIGFIFSAEGFSEEFRDHILTRSSKKSKLTASLNHYGTVDLGTMSHETPLAIMLRKEIVSSSSLRAAIFREPFKTPTLTQFIPELFHFEQDAKDHLLVSGYSGLPLVRYDLKDYGHVITKSTMETHFEESGKSLHALSANAGINPTVWNLPFVQVFERTDFSVSYFAFQIYPETIRRVVGGAKFRSICSGKFTMQVLYDKTHHQRLEIHIEQMPDVRTTPKSFTKQLVDAIHLQLCKESSEYAKTFQEKGAGLLPIIIMHPHGDPTYFTSGAKQKWVK